MSQHPSLLSFIASWANILGVLWFLAWGMPGRGGLKLVLLLLLILPSALRLGFYSTVLSHWHITTLPTTAKAAPPVPSGTVMLQCPDLSPTVPYKITATVYRASQAHAQSSEPDPLLWPRVLRPSGTGSPQSLTTDDGTESVPRPFLPTLTWTRILLRGSSSIEHSANALCPQKWSQHIQIKNLLSLRPPIDRASLLARSNSEVAIGIDASVEPGPPTMSPYMRRRGIALTAVFSPCR